MKNSIIGRLLVSVAAVVATLASGAGSAHAADLWAFIGDYNHHMGTPADVVCHLTFSAVQCYPIEPAYAPPGEKPPCLGPQVALTVALSGPATARWACPGVLGSPDGVRWERGHSEQFGRLRCVVSTDAAPTVTCFRADGSGHGFAVSRAAYQLRDGA